MALARVRSAGFEIDVELSGFVETEAALRATRNRIARRVDQEAVHSANLIIRPEARRRAGRLKVEGASIADSLVIRRIRGGARLTSRFRGIRARALGLLEFGGTVSQPIVPRHDSASDGRQALFIPGSAHPVARVRTAREYRARRFMTEARDRKLGPFAEDFRDRLVELFALEGIELA